MLKHLLSPFRATLSLLAGALLLASCDSDADLAEPVPMAGATATEFSLVDSVTVDDFFKTASPELYQNYQNRIYKVEAQNKMVAYYYEENNGITLYFKDTSGVKERSWFSLHFKNRTLKNLPATLSLKDANAVCVQNGQSFSDGSAALSPSCLEVLDGAVALEYNAQTQVLSGKVSNLKIALEYYVPDYAFPNRAGNVFKASGSTRNLNITFQNVKSQR